MKRRNFMQQAALAGASVFTAGLATASGISKEKNIFPGKKNRGIARRTYV